MTWITQQPIVIILIGVLLVIGFLFIWSRTAKSWPLYAAGVALLLTGVCVGAERYFESDDEVIRDTVLQLARAVRSNDVEAIVTHIAPQAQHCSKKVKEEMPGYVFKNCHVVQFNRLEVKPNTGRKTAQVEFAVIAFVTPHSFGFSEPTYARRTVELDLIEGADGQWLITDYTHWDANSLVGKISSKEEIDSWSK